jgi:2-dehydropantoate 2-reductase
VRICVFGAGAVGGNLAVRLALAGNEVSLVARGAALAAINTDGLQVLAGDDVLEARLSASDDPASLGPQDAVIVAAKAHQLPAFAKTASPLLHADTLVVFAQNGIPWWYPALGLQTLLDPGGAIERLVGRERSVGAVIYSANAKVGPNIIRNTSPQRNRLTIGAVDPGSQARVAQLRTLLHTAGIESPDTDDLRPAIWQKLIGNASVSVLSFLDERTSREVFDDPRLGPAGAAIAEELAAVARAEGMAIDATRAAPAPGHISSMLQDARAGRPIEATALLAAPQMIARRHAIATPCFDLLCGLAYSKAARLQAQGAA